MARLLWLADALRAGGLTVHEYDGWRTRGADTFGPVRGIVCHGTGGSLTSSDAGELRVIAVAGSNTATAPIAQLYLSRSGAWWVCASGTCTGVKTGTAGALAGLSDDSVLQIEAQHSSGEPWTAIQYGSYVRGVAALVRHGGWPVSNVVGHNEHQPREKTDPWFDMPRFRSDVAAMLNGDNDMQQSDPLVLKTSNPKQSVGDALSDLAQKRHWEIGAAQSPVPGDASTGTWPRPGSPDWNLAHLPELLKEHAAAPVDVEALAAALDARMEAAVERAVRRVLGQLDREPGS